MGVVNEKVYGRACSYTTPLSKFLDPPLLLWLANCPHTSNFPQLKHLHAYKQIFNMPKGLENIHKHFI